MLKTVRIIAAALIILLFFSGQAFALGSVIKNNFAVAVQNESARFTILFWSDGEEYVELSIKDAPEDWIVIIEPESFVAGITGSEYIYIQDEVKKAMPVYIYVKPTSMLGEQNIIITARSGRTDKGILFMQERYLNLTVDSGGSVQAEVAENNRVTETIIQFQEEKKKDYSMLYLFLIIVALVSFLIYRYS